MKRITNYLMLRTIAIVWLLAIVTVWAFADPDGEASSQLHFSWLLLIPYVIGVVGHWLKKYKLDGTGVSFKAWFLQNLGWTGGTLLGGFIAVWMMVDSAPATFSTFNPASFIAVLNTAIAADSFNQAGGNGKIP